MQPSNERFQAPMFFLVIPCFNEEEVLHETASRLRAKFDQLIQDKLADPESRVLFVDDGSKDSTWKIISELHDEDSLFSGLKLSRNEGHQSALLSGLLYAARYADAIGSMDADLQDDINVLDQMLEKIAEGYDVVYGVRNNRDTDTGFKRWTAQTFYKFQKSMGVDTVYNHADYRVITKRVAEDLGEYKEVNLFLRGIIPLIGYRSCCVYYSRGERFAGESKYNLKKMVAFAVDGITSFSIKPIKIIAVSGFIIFLLSLIALIYLLIGHAVGNVQIGWTSTMASIWLLGGLQLFAIGIVGEYVGKAYLEAKRRPRYFIDKVLLTDTQKHDGKDVTSD
ncbi:MAG: glycosyltransferase family 2 protein [Atopobium sp.]|jgi:glycosyltransferase involved in cell wall biosynthesis|nr:glycosyltransferase family 2 protein [Atopobium sp.]